MTWRETAFCTSHSYSLDTWTKTDVVGSPDSESFGSQTESLPLFAASTFDGSNFFDYARIGASKQSMLG